MTQTRHPFGVKSDPEWGASPAETNSRHELPVPRASSIKTQGNYARYAIEPLEQGYGFTLGTPLKRALLSSLPGAAVTSLRIQGRAHERRTFPHIQEEVAELVLNVKQLRLRSSSEEPMLLRVDVHGHREVTAADIQASNMVEIINPALHLATLTHRDAHLEMEIVVEKGKGYAPADGQEGADAGVIAVDAIFTPVQKVHYTVEHTRLGQLTNYDRLVLDIWTDGTISPDEALAQACQILVEQLSPVATPSHLLQQTASPSLLCIAPHVDALPIETLHLSARTYHSLKRHNLTTVGAVLMLDEDELRSLGNFGDKSLQELYERLREQDLLPPVPGGVHGSDQDSLEQ